MAQYTVIQDIEAEDKLVGPLTLRQFIYAGVAALCLYLGFLCASKGAAFLLVVFLPIAGVSGFFAFPWGRDQPTEVWALAKIRFLMKPRTRIWDQSGVQELVTVTAPKTVERPLTNGLNQTEVQSRLEALSATLDTRGWALKNANVSMINLPAAAFGTDGSDRLVQVSSLPTQVSDLDITASDDILDETANPVARHLETMIDQAAEAHRQELLQKMQQVQAPAAPVKTPEREDADYWIANQPAPGQKTVEPASPVIRDVVVAPGSNTAVKDAEVTEEEAQLIARHEAEAAALNASLGHQQQSAKTAEEILHESSTSKNVMTPEPQNDTIEEVKNSHSPETKSQSTSVDDSDDGEVVISLH